VAAAAGASEVEAVTAFYHRRDFAPIGTGAAERRATYRGQPYGRDAAPVRALAAAGVDLGAGGR
jgi:hypothetical protein